MLSALAVSGYELQPPAFAIVSRQAHRADNDGVPRLAEQTEAARSACEEQKRQFRKLYTESKRLEISPDELEQLADALLAKEQDLAAKWRPKIKLLERQIADANETEASWITLAEQMLDMTIGWLEAYQNIRIKLLKLASVRRSETEPGSPVFSDADAATEYLRRLIAE